MGIKTVTRTPTETDLEAQIHAVIKRIFFNLPSNSIRHQVRFKFNFGHRTIEIDGAQPFSAQAIADVIIFWKDKPLAVLELKRPGVKLTTEDGSQGLSYARALFPAAPLVVITNGEENVFLETQTGEYWQTLEVTEKSLKALMDSAFRAARSDMKFAIETLMGTNPNFWMQAIRKTTEFTLEELTGDLSELNQPFVRNFLIKRAATVRLLEKLNNGERLVFLEGASLSGKSSVLRELCILTSNSDQRSTLYIHNDGHSSIYQTMADTLEDSLNWTLTLDEARSWLKRLSKTDGPELVLVIDGLSNESKGIQKEIKELSSSMFGPRLKIIIALDISVATRLSTDKGRGKTTIGGRASIIKLSSLDNEEFASAQCLLEEKKMFFMKGAKFSSEYRQPWIIRSVCASAMHNARKSFTEIHIPPLSGMGLITFARERFPDIQVREYFNALAVAIIEEAKDKSLHRTLADELNLTPIIRKKTLRRNIDTSAESYLIDNGYLTEVIHHITDEHVFYVRQPALLASEISRVLEHNIIPFFTTQTKNAINWMVGVVEHLPLGGITVAHALWQVGCKNKELLTDAVGKLILIQPKTYTPSKGKEFTVFNEDGLPTTLRMLEKDVFEVLAKGQPPKIVRGKIELMGMTGDFAPWEILSHLAELQINTGMNESLNSAEGILLKIGTYSNPIYPASKESKAIKIQQAAPNESVICHESGIVEQITLSILTYLKSDTARARVFLDKILNINSIPLLCRTHIALLELTNSPDLTLSEWSQEMLNNLLLPVLQIKAPTLFSSQPSTP
ncbi:type I restriction enzyme HsdR N-terminal domain-containing protein [Pseudomonas sp. 22082]|uniref:type I restriction enzyme HsdR N-terminal domain-containing protein n=1 Tax=Pseudomonas sp. 22082 TaxID=3453868 RepID=UPI003F832871